MDRKIDRNKLNIQIERQIEGKMDTKKVDRNKDI